ncbi:MAG: putative sulfate exporter family transporter, partial [Firmicutes bacterium]|nr:putative sulfate exporter family transporter [Bacillota bacterium]
HYARKGITGRVQNKAAFLWQRLPKFLIGFLAFSLLATFGYITPAEGKILNNASKWLFMLTFAGVGLSTDFKRMRAGIKPFVVGFGVETVVSVVTLSSFTISLCNLSNSLVSHTPTVRRKSRQSQGRGQTGNAYLLPVWM